jgi:hypothetical protein
MTLSHDEMVAILEEIARDSSNGAARIAAIKALREIDDGTRKQGEGFAELDELVRRRDRRT